MYLNKLDFFFFFQLKKHQPLVVLKHKKRVEKSTRGLCRPTDPELIWKHFHYTVLSQKLRCSCWAKNLTVHENVNDVFSIQFGISGLRETWITPDKLYDAIFCFFFCFWVPIYTTSHVQHMLFKVQTLQLSIIMGWVDNSWIFIYWLNCSFDSDLLIQWIIAWHLNVSHRQSTMKISSWTTKYENPNIWLIFYTLIYIN